MRHRRPRRRGDWARRLTANIDPLSSDSDVFPCDSSSSSDSFSSHDNFLPRRPHYSLPDLHNPALPQPPHLDIRDVAFAEYAAAELPDLAIFFRTLLPPLSSPPPPIYSHRIPSFNTSLSDFSLAISSSPRSPRPPRSIPKSARLPPAFPDSSRRPHSARHSQHPHSQFRDSPPEIPSPPSSPPTLHRSRSAPIRSSHFPNHSPTSTTPRPRPSHQHSNPSQSNRPRRTSSLRTSSSLRHQSSSSRRNSVLLPSGQLPNSAPRNTPKHNSLSSSNILTTRRFPEDLELAAHNVLPPQAIAELDPDSFNHFFLMDKIYRWYTRIFIVAGEHHITLHMR